ncbi:nitrous oxide-stimulated promoter family protein [Vibrio sp. WXL103]|uniref:nitrous oxide-stimulated promoter family protein n=1 Tax=Vibrio sp. WXL103 TaxID=3450710 RepID=UPI003EC6E81B
MTKQTSNQPLLFGNLAVEHQTVTHMVMLYCQHHHQSGPPCEQCQALLEYAEQKLDRCPYGQDKPACNQCPIHCYKPAQKAQMKAVMRYAGPRMLLRHPILAIRHLIKERKAFPAKPPEGQSNRAKRKVNQ